MIGAARAGIFRSRAAGGASLPLTGLVEEWLFDEGSGQVLNGNRNNHDIQLGSTSGTDSADPQWTATPSLQFSAASSTAHVELHHGTFPEVLNNHPKTWTIIAIVKDDPADGGDRKVYVESDGGSVWTQITTGNSNAANSRLFIRDDDHTLYDFEPTLTAFESAQAHMLAVARNNQDLYMWVDNGAVQTANAGTSADGAYTSTHAYAGGHADAGYNIDEMYWLGVWNRKLDDSEVLEVYDYLKSIRPGLLP